MFSGKMLTGLRAVCGLSLLLAVLLSGCGLSKVGSNLSKALLNHDDPALIKAGAPAYLLLIDGLIEGDPDDGDWLRSGAKLYTVYAAAFVDEPARARRLSTRAFDYGQRALCAEDSAGCGLVRQPYAAFKNSVQDFDDDELPALFSFTTSWLVWAQAHKDDLSVVAAVPKIELALQRILQLDEGYENGRPWLYLGMLYSLRPPSLGGKPQQARDCFERALLLTGGKDLSVKVAYARYYARLVYDRELHDRLLYAVRNAQPKVEGLTLMNILAQQEAQQLLVSAEEYF
ncbi:MAG: TRAP transporter TatT component family protein [Thermodesulfobacteriota bacterium]|nr:TRAP transporter TatT component family protein [Thermodesulfobacteriota bacterium]